MALDVIEQPGHRLEAHAHAAYDLSSLHDHTKQAQFSTRIQNRYRVHSAKENGHSLAAKNVESHRYAQRPRRLRCGCMLVLGCLGTPESPGIRESRALGVSRQCPSPSAQPSSPDRGTCTIRTQLHISVGGVR